ncbi:DUF2232 domain-containing protein [[Clostridium] aminophilum]|uniref:Predicted membrane protein n=1 Tax=[Clostridium] aminophilum TaxID=1526 RepID=A0A1I6JTH6_9FIRM|nr:DUF2232 domain-containing protein [[Clostridium] aminophilum]SFR82272.1 Predicted membrane protein [[Clostridium] aminophilum]
MNRTTDTMKLTTGAMIVAIFGVFLVINLQTGGLLAGIFTYVLPIPMVAYGAKYGLKSSVPVFICMAIAAFLISPFTTFFYAIAGAFIGLVYGACIHRRMDMTKALLIVMAIAAISELAATLCLSSVSGYDLGQQVTEMRSMMDQTFGSAGVVMPENMMEGHFLLQMMILGVAMMGVMEGFIVSRLSLIVLRRLRIQVPAPTPIRDIYPPKWTGYVALAASFGYMVSFSQPLAEGPLQGMIQSVGMVGYMYLILFGMTAIGLLVRRYWGKGGLLTVLACMTGLMFFSAGVLVMGFFYVSAGYHKNLAEAIRKKEEARANEG